MSRSPHAGPGLHILQVSSYGPDHLGGLEACAEMLARHLPSPECQFRWAYCVTKATPDSEVGRPLFAFDPLETSTGVPCPLPFPSAVARLWRLVRQADVLLVHDALYLLSALAIAFALIKRKPVTLLVHVWRVPYRSRILMGLQHLVRSTIGRWCLRRADAVVTYNEQIQTELEFLLADRACHFIPNGIHDDFAGRNREETSRPPASRRVVFAGRFVEKKGLSVIREMAARLPGIEFELCGDGPIDPSSWGQPNVKVRGRLTRIELAQRYAGADLFLLPSRGEGFPLAIQEAMRCGLPAAIFPETFDAWDRDADQFVLLDDATPWDSLAHALHEPLSASRRCEMRRYAEKHWQWPATAARYRAIFQALQWEPAARFRPWAPAPLETP